MSKNKERKLEMFEVNNIRFFLRMNPNIVKFNKQLKNGSEKHTIESLAEKFKVSMKTIINIKYNKSYVRKYEHDGVLNYHK